LRKSLVANAISSGIFGLAFILFADGISDWLKGGLTVDTLPIGVILLLFAGDIFHQVTCEQLSTKRALVTSLGDALWVVATILILVTQPDALSPGGEIAAILVALMVGAFGFLQILGIRRIKTNQRVTE